MKVSYVEGVANHNGSKSCGAAREDGVEALIGGRTGRVLNLEIHDLRRKQQALWEADALELVGRQYQVHRHRKVHQDPARSETPCIYASTWYRNRKIPRLSAEERTADRVGKPGTPMTNGRGESNSSVIPTKSPNNAEGPAAEASEGRGLAKGNSPERNTGLRAGKACPARSSGYVKPQSGINNGSLRSSTTTQITFLGEDQRSAHDSFSKRIPSMLRCPRTWL
jgi:RNA-directed DNA polymerase